MRIQMLLYAIELSHVQRVEFVKYGLRNIYPDIEKILIKIHSVFIEVSEK